MTDRGQCQPLPAARPPQESIWKLDQYPGAIPLERIRSCRSPVRQIFQYLQSLTNNGVALFSLDVGDEPQTAGVVFVGGIVESLPLRNKMSFRFFLSFVAHVTFSPLPERSVHLSHRKSDARPF